MLRGRVKNAHFYGFSHNVNDAKTDVEHVFWRHKSTCFFMFLTCFLDAVLYIVENFLKNSRKTPNFQKHHFGGLCPPGIVFRYIFNFRKKWMYTSVYYFRDDTFWVLLEVGKVLILKVNGVGVGVGGRGVGVVCFFLL